MFAWLLSVAVRTAAFLEAHTRPPITSKSCFCCSRRVQQNAPQPLLQPSSCIAKRHRAVILTGIHYSSLLDWSRIWRRSSARGHGAVLVTDQVARLHCGVLCSHVALKVWWKYQPSRCLPLSNSPSLRSSHCFPLLVRPSSCHFQRLSRTTLEMAELAIGGVSFFFQVFAGCIQGWHNPFDYARRCVNNFD